MVIGLLIARDWQQRVLHEMATRLFRVAPIRGAIDHENTDRITDGDQAVQAVVARQVITLDIRGQQAGAGFFELGRQRDRQRLPGGNLVDRGRLLFVGAAIDFKRHGQVLRGILAGVFHEDRDRQSALGVRNSAGVRQVYQGYVGDRFVRVAAPNHDERAALPQLRRLRPNRSGLPVPTRLLQIGEQVNFLVRPGPAIE